MGSSKNAKVRKPGGAKALAGEHKKNQPKGATWGCLSFTLSLSQTLHSKKVKSGARVKAGSRA